LRRPGVFAALLLALVAAACALPGSAFAIEQRPLVESIGTDGTTSGTPFGNPAALTFDQGNKHLYALDGETQKIHGYDASTVGTHTPLGGSFPLTAPGAGFFDDIGVNSSSHNLYFASVGENKLFGFDTTGATLSGFPVSGHNFPCGVATDSSNNIWVAEGNEGKLQKYSPAGALLGTITIGGEPCDLAFDSADNLYVSFFFGSTKKYTAASNYTSSTEVDGETTNAITVDQSTDELYVAHFNYVSVYAADGTFLYEFGKSIASEEAEFSGVAIDQATEQVYVSSSREKKVLVFGAKLPLPQVTTEGTDNITATTATVHGTINPKGEAVLECHFEVVPASQFNSSKYGSVTAAEKFPCVPAAGSIPADSNPHAVSANVTGLTPATAYHYRLVATNAIGETKGSDRVFNSGPVSPLVEEESVEAAGTSEATLAAKINPRGGETTYHVEYGTTNAYGQSTAESVAFGFPTDNGKHPVSVHIGGLVPGTAYHFRFVASNKAGSAGGADTSFFTYPATSPSFGPCPDDQFRTGFGSQLPDCRAYEQGTPIEKHGSNALGVFVSVGVSSSGNRFSFFATGGLPTTGGLSSIVPFIASRGPNGWSTDGILPPTEPNFIGEVLGTNEDLSATLVKAEGPGGVGRQLFVRNSETATFEPGPVGPENFFPSLVGFAADPAHLALTSQSQLLPEAILGKSNLYDLDHGALTLASRIPAGSATTCDDEAGPACVVSPQGATRPARISPDGSRVFFTVHGVGQLGESSGRIYMREDGDRTKWISASQRTTPDPNGEKPAELLGISGDGSKVFFTGCEKLTDDSTAFSNGENACGTFNSGANKYEQGSDLYAYDVRSGELTDLTVDPNVSDPRRAQVKSLLGTSVDGSYVYFTAEGVLAPGASNSLFKPNFYVYHDGVTKFIAKATDGGEEQVARVSASGRALLFRSRASLTGYNNNSRACPGGGSDVGPCYEFFRYSAPEGKLFCVSCNPTGVPPSGIPSLGSSSANLFVKGSAAGGLSRNLSADGSRVFFESNEALVLSDTNGAGDVYEWEAKGAGSCESESQNGGCIYLISTGTSAEPVQFLGASASGDHAFFFTGQQLVPTDKDVLLDVYDAGVGAGLAAQHTLSPPSCASTACQANPAPPPDQTPASAAFSGPGNAHQRSKARKCPKGKRKVRQAGKVSCQKAHKQHKRHNNRGGAK
jgi:hypothetical protein